MNSRSRELLDAICDELRAHGINDWIVTHRKRHPAVMFQVNGKSRSVIFSGSPSSTRCVANQRRSTRAIIRGTDTIGRLVR